MSVVCIEVDGPKTLAATPAYCNTSTAPAPEAFEVKPEQAGQTLALDAGEAACSGRSLAPMRLATTRL